MVVKVHAQDSERAIFCRGFGIRWTCLPRLFALLLVALAMQGCATAMMHSQKASGYDRQVKELVVLYFQRARMEIDGSRARSVPWQEVQKFLDWNHFYEFPEKIQRLLPEELEPYGVKMQLKIVSELPESYDAYSPAHVLILDPSRISLLNIRGPVTPDGLVHCTLNLYESPSKDAVWHGSWVVQLSNYRYLTDQEVREFAITLAMTFRSEGLVKKTR